MADAKHIELPNGTILDLAGSGGEGSGYTETVLWEGDKTNTGEITLTDNISNYDILYFICGVYTSRDRFVGSIPVKQFKTDIILGLSYSESTSYMASLQLSYINDNTINITYNYASKAPWDTRLKTIIGIKFHSGPMSLVAGNYEYSEEEKIVGKWLDGRPVYKKSGTIDINKSDNNVICTISELDRLIHCETNVKIVDANYATHNYYVQSGESTHTYSDSNGNIIFYSSWSGICIFDILYTKTTDAPNSFKPEMISAVEIPVKHKYSTEEKIVGEWIDGKPVYEKTIELAGTYKLYNTSWTNINIKIDNVDLVTFLTIVNYSKTERIIVMTARCYPENDYLYFAEINSIELSDAIITIQYTKTTD